MTGLPPGRSIAYPGLVPTPRPADADAEPGIEARSLTRTLNLIGDAWTVLLLKEFFSGQHRFQDLQARLGIPRQTLMLRLTQLVEAEILYRRPVIRRGVQQEYHLTPKGLDLYPFVLAVWDWHRRWDGEVPFLPYRLVHRSCGQALTPRFVCQACGDEVRRDAVVMRPGPGAGTDPRPAPRLSREKQATGAAGTGLVAASLLGDRWGYLVAAEMFRGTTSFHALTQRLRISPSTLSSRLAKLRALGLIEPVAGGGRRIDYRFTDRGEGLWPILATLSGWGDRWLAGMAGVPEVAVHRCGAVLSARYVCAACGGVVPPWDVAPAPR